MRGVSVPFMPFVTVLLQPWPLSLLPTYHNLGHNLLRKQVCCEHDSLCDTAAIAASDSPHPAGPSLHLPHSPMQSEDWFQHLPALQVGALMLPQFHLPS